MNLHPLVSIAIPAYSPQFFEEALRSAIGQSYPNLEVVVTDDCRGDGIRRIVERCAAQTQVPIRYFHNAEQLGGLRNLSRCLEESSGLYVKFLNDDDLLREDCVERMAAVLQNNPEVALVTSRRRLIDAEGRQLADVLETFELFREDVQLAGGDIVSLLGDRPLNFIGEPSTVMFRRAQLIDKAPNLCALGGVVIRAINDLALYTNLLQHGDLAYLHEPLSSFRRHGAQRQAQADMAELFRQGSDNFFAKVRELGLYTEGLAGSVRRRPLGSTQEWRAFALRALLQDNERRVIRRTANKFGPLSLDGGEVLRDVLVEQYPAIQQGKAPLGVVIHAFYPDVLRDLLARLAFIQQPLHLYVTCVAEGAAEVRAALDGSGLPYSLFRVDNRGRDVLPFLRVLPYVRRDGIAVLLKLHTKKSAHLEQAGVEWARELYDLLLDPVYLQNTLERFEETSRVHLVGPDQYRLPIAQYLRGNNRQHLLSLAGRAGLSEEQVMTGEFYAGTMFYARLASLDRAIELGLSAEDFEPEEGQLEGTLAHAMERFFGVLAQGHALADRATLYRQWLNTRKLDVVEQEGLDARIASWSEAPSVLLVVHDIYPEQGLVARTLESLKEQLYQPGAVLVLSDREPEGIEPADNLLWLPTGGDWLAQLNEALPQIGVDWFYLLRGGDVLDPHALLLLAERITERPGMRCAYSDEDRYLPGSGEEPVFKPDFNLDMLRSYPYVGRGLAFQREAFIECDGFDTGHAELAPQDLLLRLSERYGLPCVEHLAEVLLHQHEHLGQWLLEPGVAPRVAPLVAAHLDRLGVPHAILPGALSMINRVLYAYPELPLVSIIIPTKDQLGMLRRCVESLLEKTRYSHYEVLIVDNGSETPEAIEWLAGLEAMDSNKVRVLRYPHPFNFSAINNFAARHARGEYLVLLNNDTAITDSAWLDGLLNHARRPEVGVVGAKLHYPDGRIQHGGVVLGLRGVADHPFIGAEQNAKGYMQRLQIDQNYSAVTAACLMVRKSVYDEVGGMDEGDFKVSYNDVDLCLKVGAAGYLLVWTPYAVVLHEANVSQVNVDKTALEAKIERFRGEQAAMYRRWLPRLAWDPAYNRNLNLTDAGFALDHRAETGWQPFASRHRPSVLCYAADPYGCGHYRMIQPFAAMHAGHLLQGGVSDRLMSVVELERLAPDAVIFQRQVLPVQQDVLRDAKAFSGAFRVFELDDYIVDLPHKNPHRQHMPKDIANMLRTSVALCDRFVVSSEPLAEAFSRLGLHSDIRVIGNRLPISWWGALAGDSQRRVGRKPRVGWAGGVGHTGDLELIAEVVKALANEVEWVFMGLCPDTLRPYVHEFHRGVPIVDYPRKLASLNLDLALAPLEQNLFNECKSNLRLLEYGACGYPVICTDILCYEGDLPVTRVRNQTSAWIAAIREQLADMDALAAAGDALRHAVQRDWMLEGQHLEAWRAAWLPD
ncbi:glycosyltransferase [Pseudomonas citronellolis]|uniref:glycosyltransferase n=1 Tax=Pseudomonas citronellolis TaxID=53408 RepID=UPI0023E35315|nr:glycosyltransferase [Pseudomonas citronellolis]MDF3936913.1 glycosyltransferase [Pseudomonas citronellolis]